MSLASTSKLWLTEWLIKLAWAIITKQHVLVFAQVFNGSDVTSLRLFNFMGMMELGWRKSQRLPVVRSCGGTVTIR